MNESSPPPKSEDSLPPPTKDELDRGYATQFIAAMQKIIRSPVVFIDWVNHFLRGYDTQIGKKIHPTNPPSGPDTPPPPPPASPPSSG